MIGLGSNRLTVCRRGGMSVTQAGSGGMEWLAGGRSPLWASPYSAAATAALKDAFTAAQWQTIKAYGFAHPEYIAAINFAAPQDPEIMYSLIPELGKTRYITRTGAAYVNTEIKLHSLSDGLYCKYYRPSTSGGYFVLSSDGANYSNRNMHSGVYYWRTGYNINSNSSPESTAVSGQCPTGSMIESFVSKDLRYLKQDGITKATNNGTYTTDFTTPNNLWIFHPTNGAEVRMYEVKIEGTHAAWFIPCKHQVNGELKEGMLDVISATWKGNANSSGSFTISETPAS